MSDIIRNADRAAYDAETRATLTPGERAMEQLAEAVYLAGSLTPYSQDKRDFIRVGLYVGDMGPFYLTVRPSSGGDWGVWARTFIADEAEYKAGKDGLGCGNRCGARNVLTRLFMPAVQRAMAGDETDAAADDDARLIAELRA